MPYDDILFETEERMEKSLHFLEDEYKKLRGGRASTGLVENLKVDCYGAATPLKQIATIGVPEPMLLVIRPYDTSQLAAVEKAILASELGITPSNDGKLIRMNVPPLSEERRRHLVGQTKSMAEEARVAVRNERRDAIKAAEKEEKAGDMTEDDLKQFKTDVQELTDKYTGSIDKTCETKSDELMQV
jgi:ribosome recycling factor